MNDLAITGTSVATGLALGGLTGVAAGSKTGGALGAAAGLALGGVVGWAAQRDEGGVDFTKPRHALPLMIGSGVGLGVASLYTTTSTLSKVRSSAALGAAALAGGLIAYGLTNTFPARSAAW